MKAKLFIFVILLTGLSCDEDEKTIETVEEGREFAAYIRTIETFNADFSVGNPQDTFGITVEVNDEEDGGLLDAIDVYIAFKPFEDSPKSEMLLKTLDSELFSTGAFGLPRTRLDISFTEALTASGLSLDQVACRDQFEVRLDLKLTDGRSFTSGAASSKILAADDFWSSPFCYTINVVEPIAEGQFTGFYTMESILDGPLGATFGDDVQIVEIYKGHSTNTREILLRHRLSILQEFKRIFRFTVACDNIVFSKNILSSKIGFCDRGGPPILLGPDSENGSADPLDDTVFEMWFVEGYLGFDGHCEFGTAPSRYRFTKQ